MDASTGDPSQVVRTELLNIVSSSVDVNTLGALLDRARECGLDGSDNKEVKEETNTLGMDVAYAAGMIQYETLKTSEEIGGCSLFSWIVIYFSQYSFKCVQRSVLKSIKKR